MSSKGVSGSAGRESFDVGHTRKTEGKLYRPPSDVTYPPSRPVPFGINFFAIAQKLFGGTETKKHSVKMADTQWLEKHPKIAKAIQSVVNFMVNIVRLVQAARSKEAQPKAVSPKETELHEVRLSSKQQVEFSGHVTQMDSELAKKEFGEANALAVFFDLWVCSTRYPFLLRDHQGLPKKLDRCLEKLASSEDDLKKIGLFYKDIPYISDAIARRKAAIGKPKPVQEPVQDQLPKLAAYQQVLIPMKENYQEIFEKIDEFATKYGVKFPLDLPVEKKFETIQMVMQEKGSSFTKMEISAKSVIKMNNEEDLSSKFEVVNKEKYEEIRKDLEELGSLKKKFHQTVPTTISSKQMGEIKTFIANYMKGQKIEGAENLKNAADALTVQLVYRGFPSWIKYVVDTELKTKYYNA